jgi:hypothetical protein
MASILSFRKRSRPGPPLPRGSSPATIIIFPGVRYERTTSPGTAAAWSGRQLMPPPQTAK